MPDTGFYTYGRDLEARAWHRQTCVHQTLTLNEEDSKIAGEHLLWASDPSFDAVTVQNPSYPDLLHRRSVWFVDKGGDGFFAILDEALGGADGTLDLNFQFAPGQIETGEDWAKTLFEDANVLVRTVATSPCDLTTSDGWMGWAYGSRTERQAIRFRLDGNAPAAFLTLIIPFRGTAQPATVLALPENYEPGADRVEVGVSAFGQAWQVGRDLSTGEAWCKLT
jgi:heparan-sulfate lyase